MLHNGSDLLFAVPVFKAKQYFCREPEFSGAWNCGTDLFLRRAERWMLRALGRTVGARRPSQRCTVRVIHVMCDVTRVSVKGGRRLCSSVRRDTTPACTHWSSLRHTIAPPASP